MDQIAFWNLTWRFICIQIIGLIGLLMNVISFQANTNKRIVRMQIFGCLFWIVHFMLLGQHSAGAYTGAALNAAGLLRNCVFALRPRKWAAHPAWLYIFCVGYILCGIFTWSGPVSLLPTAAMLLGTVGLYVLNPKITRRFGMVASCGWLIYNVLTRSFAGIVCEIFTQTSIVVAMVKFDRKSVPEGSTHDNSSCNSKDIQV